MEGDGFFTNMLSNGSTDLGWDGISHVEEPQSPNMDGISPVEEPQSPNVDNTPSMRPNQKRTKNFSVPEDELLVSAWLNISMDPMQGINQTRSTYWKRIYDYFYSNKDFASNRSQKSLMNRWGAIQESVNKFCGCISRIESRRQSGVTIEDKLMQASALFKSEDSQKKSFQLMHCWVLLKSQPKWIEKYNQLSSQKSFNKKQKTTFESSPDGCSLDNDNNEHATLESNDTHSRPIGKKRAKEALRQGGQVGYVEALDHLWAKKEDADGEKERKKEERYKEVYALQRERFQLEQVKVANEEKKITVEE